MNTQFNFESIASILFQGLGAMLAFAFSLILISLIFPLLPAIMEAKKTVTGFLPTPMDFLFNAAANALILIWAALAFQFQRVGNGWTVVCAFFWHTGFYNSDRDQLFHFCLPVAAR